MSQNEVQSTTDVHPEVANFLSSYHVLNKQFKDAERKIESQEAIIATLEDQLDGMREIVKEVSAKSDYYMRLSVEMRTHFLAMQAITKEAEKCFNGGPYRNNGAVSKETLKIQMVTDEVDKQSAMSEDELEEVKERMQQLAVPLETNFERPKDDKIPSFLTEVKKDEVRQKVKGWTK